MAGRILNRAARDKTRNGLIELIGTIGRYNGLKLVMELAHVTLDAGPDIEAVRSACNERRIYLSQFSQKVRAFEDAIR